MSSKVVVITTMAVIVVMLVVIQAQVQYVQAGAAEIIHLKHVLSIATPAQRKELDKVYAGDPDYEQAKKEFEQINSLNSPSIFGGLHVPKRAMEPVLGLP